MKYFLLRQDRTANGAAGVRGLPEDMDELDWFKGKKMRAPKQKPLRLQFTPHVRGDFKGDLIQTAVTVVSDKLRNALTEFGVDNIDYFPVEIENPKTGSVVTEYWLANIIGLVACMDEKKSEFEKTLTRTWLKSLYIDAKRAPELPLFRLGEKATLIVINEPLKKHLEAAGLNAVRLQPTEDYDGF